MDGKVKALANEIFSLAMEISESTKSDVFFNYSPHVQWISVDFFGNGWETKKEEDWTETVYLKAGFSAEDLEKLKKRIISSAEKSIKIKWGTTEKPIKASADQDCKILNCEKGEKNEE